MDLKVRESGVNWEAALFQDDLIAAKTMTELQTAKSLWPQEVREWAMKAWKADGQYSLFEAKVEVLKKRDEKRRQLI